VSGMSHENRQDTRRATVYLGCDMKNRQDTASLVHVDPRSSCHCKRVPRGMNMEKRSCLTRSIDWQHRLLRIGSERAATQQLELRSELVVGAGRLS